ncbi:MAG: hypothetical protein HRT61_00870 [Ekhidna sp.]|nr:hypothetical protein [Ekhidna sp.]
MSKKPVLIEQFPVVPDVIEGFINSIEWVDDYTLDPLNFVHGTPLMTTTQFSRIDDSKLRFPLCYLPEFFTGRKYNRYSPIQAEVNLRLFFLVNVKSEDLTTDDHYANPLDLMRRYVEIFTSHMAYYEAFQIRPTDAPYPFIFHANAGRYADRRGYDARIFQESTSGIEINFTALNLIKCDKTRRYEPNPNPDTGEDGSQGGGQFNAWTVNESNVVISTPNTGSSDAPAINVINKSSQPWEVVKDVQPIYDLDVAYFDTLGVLDPSVGTSVTVSGVDGLTANVSGELDFSSVETDIYQLTISIFSERENIQIKQQVKVRNSI